MCRLRLLYIFVWRGSADVARSASIHCGLPLVTSVSLAQVQQQWNLQLVHRNTATLAVDRGLSEGPPNRFCGSNRRRCSSPFEASR